MVKTKQKAQITTTTTPVAEQQRQEPVDGEQPQSPQPPPVENGEQQNGHEQTPEQQPLQTAVPSTPKENSEENVVYVYPSKQTEHISSMSPECLAIETSLRFKKILYKYATGKFIEKPHGEPAILLNEKEYVGVDKIEEAISMLPATGCAEPLQTPTLNADQQADCQAYIYALVDTVLYQVLYVQRFKHTTSTTAELDIIKRVKSGFQRLFRVGGKEEDRIGKLKPEQLTEIVKDGLSAINNYLKRGGADKQYFFGDKPTKHDAVLFGVLAQYWLEPPTSGVGSTTDFTLKSLTESVCADDNKIIQYLQRIKETYWPDWQDRCAKPAPPPTVASPTKRGTFRKSKVTKNAVEKSPQSPVVESTTTPVVVVQSCALEVQKSGLDTTTAPGGDTPANGHQQVVEVTCD